MLGPLTSTIQGVVDFTWPMIIISVVIIVSVRLTYLIKYKERIIIYKELLTLAFVIYILCLFQVVTFQDDVTWASNNFIPFREIMRYNITSPLFLKNVIGNMLMFLPFGFFISFYIKADNIKLPIILTIIASIAIETVQMIIGRVFDIDDIILNIIGSSIGYLVYYTFRKVNNRYPKILKNELVLNIISVCILIGLIIVLI